jgi:hypothetical protein
MCAGADSIEDADRLRVGATAKLFDAVRAPSTLGTFLRSFTHGHNRQLHGVHRDFLARLAASTPLLPSADRVAFVDVDPTPTGGCSDAPSRAPRSAGSRASARCIRSGYAVDAARAAGGRGGAAAARETLNPSTSRGLRPKARQIRCTLVGEIPTTLASSRFDPVGGSLGHLLQRPDHDFLHLGVGYRARHAGPRLSLIPANRCLTKRVRHRPALSRLSRNSAATALFVIPSAHISTMRAR